MELFSSFFFFEKSDERLLWNVASMKCSFTSRTYKYITICLSQPPSFPLSARRRGLITSFINAYPRKRIAGESQVAATTRREAERVWNDVTVVSHRSQLSIDVFLLTAGLVTLGEAINHVAPMQLVATKQRMEWYKGSSFTIDVTCIISFFFIIDYRLYSLANLDAYALFEVVLVHDEQPFLTLIFCALRIDDLFLRPSVIARLTRINL